jgi:hypothetical protein
MLVIQIPIHCRCVLATIMERTHRSSISIEYLASYSAFSYIHIFTLFTDSSEMLCRYSHYTVFVYNCARAVLWIISH